jgi:hypothetical protein
MAWLAGTDETQNYELPIAVNSTPRLRRRRKHTDEAEKPPEAPKASLRQRAVWLALAKGEVRTKDLTDIGVPRCYLTPMCDEGLLVKIGYGRYRAATNDSEKVASRSP